MGTLAQNLDRLSPEQRLYSLQSLPAHLTTASRGAELVRVLTAFEFIQAKVTALGPAPLAADYELASEIGLGLDDVDVAGLSLIGDAVRLSEPVLAAQPTHLASQLLARLSPADGRPVAQVLEQALAGPGGPWLRPLRPSLSRAGGPLRYILTGHQDRVRAIAITSDGKRAVSASDDKTLIVWDLVSGTALHTLRGHTDQIYTVAVIHDGSLAISGCNDRTVRVWDLERGSLRRTLRGHEAYVKAVTMTANNALAISVAADQTVVWDLESGLPVVRRDGHSGYASSVVVLPDSQHALSPADDHSLRIWEVQTGLERPGGVLVGHTDNVNTIAVAPDGQRAVSGSQDGMLILWDLDQAAPLQSWKMDERGINQVAFLPDGCRIMAVGETSTLTIWDLDSGASVWQTTDGQEGIKAVAVSADGELALSAPFDSTVKVWNLPALLGTGDQQEAPEPISSVACAGPYAFSQQGQVLTAWDVASAQERFVLTGYRFVAAAPAMDRALLLSPSRELELWDLARPLAICPLPGTQPVAFLPNGSELLVAREDGVLGRYRTQDGAELGILCCHSGPVTSLVLSEDGRVALSAGEDGTTRLWDLACGDEAGRLHVGKRQVTHVALTPDARYAVVGLDDGRLISWPTRDTWAGLWMRWRQASRRALAGTARGASALLRRILDPGGERSKIVLTPRPAKRSVTALVLAAGGQRAITASRGGFIRVWNLRCGSVRHTLRHKEWENMALLPDGSYAVAHSLSLAFGYGRRQVWDLSTGTAIGELPAGTLLPKVFLRPGPDGSMELVAAIAAMVKPESVAMKRFREPERELSIWALEKGEAALSFVGDFDWSAVSVAADGRTVVAGDSVGQMHFLRSEGLESLRPIGTKGDDRLPCGSMKGASL